MDHNEFIIMINENILIELENRYIPKLPEETKLFGKHAQTQDMTMLHRQGGRVYSRSMRY